MNMKLYRIINPSDDMTLYAPSILVAGVAVALLGQGGIGAVNVSNDDECTPVLFGWDRWFEAQGVANLSRWLDQEENKRLVAEALKTVMLGSPHDRADLDDALAAIESPEKKAEFIKKRNDRRRSSMSDWESQAHRIAEQLVAASN